MNQNNEVTSGYAQVEEEVNVFQEQIDTLLNLADIIGERIAVASSIKVTMPQLVNARAWCIELARVFGSKEDYQTKATKPERKLMSVVINGEIQILNEIVQFIEHSASNFQQALEQYNKPLIEKIQKLRELGEKTREDQEEVYKQVIVLTYPYFQLICQNLMEAKFQYENRI